MAAGRTLIRFQAEGQAETTKRRGRIPRHSRGHLCRWPHRRGTHVVIFRGKPVARVKMGITKAAKRAGSEGVTPHVPTRTAITWANQDGLHVEDAADFRETCAETIRKHHWHHSPYHQCCLTPISAVISEDLR